MARARNIKPGFFMNEDLTELSFEYRLLFIGLWTLADREGKLEDRPKRIKMELFPADNVDVDQGLSELERYGFVERYEVGGLRIVMILKFTDHQRPHHTEKASELPNKDGSMPVAAPKKSEVETSKPGSNNGEITVKGALSDGGNPPDSLNPDSLNPDSLNPDSLIPDSLIPDSGFPLTDSGYQREDGPAAAQPDPAPTKAKAPRATRLPTDWQLPAEWEDWALTEQPSWTPEGVRRVADQFRDYWTAKGGADARKVDWEATWRNWVRREKSPGLGRAPAAGHAPLNRQEALEARNREVAERLARTL